MKAFTIALVALAAATAADGSIWITTGARNPALEVDARGYAEVSWTEGGARRTQLVPPAGKVLPGGRISGLDVSRPVRVPGLPFPRVVRRTPDGRLWALQEWQQPGAPAELHLARWKGKPTELTLAFDGRRLTGRAVFQGRPVTGFSTTPAGQRLRIFVSLDCFACPGGSGGWTRMLGVAPKGDGTFAVLVRPEWSGKRYRATVAGPNLSATLAPDARTVISGG